MAGCQHASMLKRLVAKAPSGGHQGCHGPRPLPQTALSRETLACLGGGQVGGRSDLGPPRLSFDRVNLYHLNGWLLTPATKGRGHLGGARHKYFLVAFGAEAMGEVVAVGSSSWRKTPRSRSLHGLCLAAQLLRAFGASAVEKTRDVKRRIVSH